MRGRSPRYSGGPNVADHGAHNDGSGAPPFPPPRRPGGAAFANRVRGQAPQYGGTLRGRRQDGRRIASKLRPMRAVPSPRWPGGAATGRGSGPLFGPLPPRPRHRRSVRCPGGRNAPRSALPTTMATAWRQRRGRLSGAVARRRGRASRRRPGRAVPHACSGGGTRGEWEPLRMLATVGSSIGFTRRRGDPAARRARYSGGAGQRTAFAARRRSSARYAGGGTRRPADSDGHAWA